MDLPLRQRSFEPHRVAVTQHKTASQASPEGFKDVLSNASVLVIDDEPGMRNFLKKTLTEYCARVDVAADTDEAALFLDQANYDIIILDNVMPKKKGVDWLAEQKKIGLYSDAILMTAYADLETAIAAIRAGASDFLLKPFRSNQILNAITQNLKRSNLSRQNLILRNELEAGQDLLRHRHALIGNSDLIQKVRNTIEHAASIDAHVVICGEVGAGKQIAARMLHDRSARSDCPFVWLQCHGLNEEAFKSTLFGRVDASAESDMETRGLLLNAKGGTLFLEDVERLPPACQNLLVELLTTSRFRPIGAERSFPVDVRIVCSTTLALKDAVQESTFRTDLYYLLNIHEITLPPLRERVEDIVALAEFFREKLVARMGVPAPEISASAKRRLMAHEWPGNVMELRNIVERALIRGTFDSVVDIGQNNTEPQSLAAVERRHILSVLDACSGNRAEAARRLGVARKTIDRKCQTWGV